MFNPFLDGRESAESCLNFMFYLSADSDDQRYMLTVFERWQMSLSARFTPGARWKTIIYRWDMGEASCASRFQCKNKQLKRIVIVYIANFVYTLKFFLNSYIFYSDKLFYLFMKLSAVTFVRNVRNLGKKFSFLEQIS